MAYLTGAALAAAVGLLATVVGFVRDRAFYPTVMIIIASCQVLFVRLARQGATARQAGVSQPRAHRREHR